MKIYAVISEFNPFHNGHKYLADTLHERCDCAVVAIMSGGFVERGDVAVIDKYARAEAAVMCGVDLVLELPAPWCFAGAEFFALGGVAVADGIGVCDALAFGSESGDIASLIEAAERLASDTFASALESERAIRQDVGTAALRADIYARLYGGTDIFGGSNNLLALEYLHALSTLGSSVEPYTVKRVGGEFNSDVLGGVCSATAIRGALSRGETDMSGCMPPESAAVLKRELDAGRLYELSRLDTAVIAMLRAGVPSAFGGIMEISGGMENKLCRAAASCRSIDELVDTVKSKRYSASRVRRALISAMLGVTMSDVEAAPLFTAVLASNARGREVLAAARKRSRIAILAKMSDSRTLTGRAAEQYALHMRAERLCELCCHGEPRRVGAVIV